MLYDANVYVQTITMQNWHWHVEQKFAQSVFSSTIAWNFRGALKKTDNFVHKPGRLRSPRGFQIGFYVIVGR